MLKNTSTTNTTSRQAAAPRDSRIATNADLAAVTAILAERETINTRPYTSADHRLRRYLRSDRLARQLAATRNDDVLEWTAEDILRNEG